MEKISFAIIERGVGTKQKVQPVLDPVRNGWIFNSEKIDVIQSPARFLAPPLPVPFEKDLLGHKRHQASQVVHIGDLLPRELLQPARDDFTAWQGMVKSLFAFAEEIGRCVRPLVKGAQ